MILDHHDIDRARGANTTARHADAIGQHACQAVSLNADVTLSGDFGATFTGAALSTNPGTHHAAVVADGHPRARTHNAATGGICARRHTVDRVGRDRQAANSEITFLVNQRFSGAFKHQHTGAAGDTGKCARGADYNIAGGVGGAGINIHRTAAGDLGAAHPRGDVSTDGAGIRSHRQRGRAER